MSASPRSQFQHKLPVSTLLTLLSGHFVQRQYVFETSGTKVPLLLRLDLD